MKTLLQTLGLRSECCNAKIVAWHSDKFYCANCKQWLPVAVSAAAPAKASKKTTKRAARKHIHRLAI